MLKEHNDVSKLATGLSRVERRHKRFMNRALAEKGIPGIPYTYVTVIKNNPGVNQDHIADIQGVDKSRVARIIRSLELEGYLSRTPHPGDRRNYQINLTDKGKELCILIEQCAEEWATLISKGIEQSELSIMVHTMEKIIQNLDEYGYRRKARQNG